MTKEERKRIGRKLRALRIERGKHQADVAADLRAAGLSLGTLQAIEGAWYDVRDTNIEKYAGYFGTSITKLLHADEPKPLTPSDPLLKDLNEEHLEIARSYMRARKDVRTCIELLFNNSHEQQLTTLILKLHKLSTHLLTLIDRLLQAPPDDPVFAVIETLLNHPELVPLVRDYRLADAKGGELWRRFDKLPAAQQRTVAMAIEELEARLSPPTVAPTPSVLPKKASRR